MRMINLAVILSNKKPVALQASAEERETLGFISITNHLPQSLDIQQTARSLFFCH